MVGHLSQSITSLGDWLIQSTLRLGEFSIFSADSLRRALVDRPRARHITAQFHAIGIESMPIANLTAFFVGMVMVLNTGYQLALFGVQGWAAGITAIALAREMVPIFTAIVVGARVAASIAAELGTMRVTEQIDAMAVSGINPISHLVVPRVIGTFVMLPIITLYSLVIGFIGGMLVGHFAMNINPMQFYQSSLDWIVLSDLWTGLAKTFFFALIIALVGCYHGFNTRGGAAGVGKSTTGAVVVSLVAILISNYVMSTWFLVIFGQM